MKETKYFGPPKKTKYPPESTDHRTFDAHRREKSSKPTEKSKIMCVCATWMRSAISTSDEFHEDLFILLMLRFSFVHSNIHISLCKAKTPNQNPHNSLLEKHTYTIYTLKALNERNREHRNVLSLLFHVFYLLDCERQHIATRSRFCKQTHTHRDSNSHGKFSFFSIIPTHRTRTPATVRKRNKAPKSRKCIRVGAGHCKWFRKLERFDPFSFVLCTLDSLLFFFFSGTSSLPLSCSSIHFSLFHFVYYK